MISTVLLFTPLLAAPAPQDGVRLGRRPAQPAPVAAQPAASLEDRVEDSFDPFGLDDHSQLPKGTSIFPDPAASQPFVEIGAPAMLSAGGPFNDNCANATIIPATSVHYAQNLFTNGSTTESCEPAESCESGGVGTSASVWFEYIPERDGRIVVDTLGSDYNTVLSIFDGCGFALPPFGCFTPTELACNDDYFFGTTSQVSLEVTGGELYKIKAAQFGSGSGGLLDFDLYFYPQNDACDSATPILGVAFADSAVPVQNAGSDLCEPDESCEFNGVGTSRSVWYSFIAPCDGTLDLNTNGSSYDTVLSVWDGCGVFQGVDVNCELPSEIACNDDSGTGTNSQLIGVAVAAGEEYRIKIAAYSSQAQGGYLTFNALFRPASPPLAEITDPSNFGCVCLGTYTVVGTASAGNEPIAEWKLEHEPTTGGARTTIVESTTPIEDDTLALWNTSTLATGNYLLHLTVTAACGATSTATRVIRVDGTAPTAVIDAPQNGTVLGGVGCADGTVWDVCFERYSVELAPAGTSAFTPIGGDTVTRTNEALIPGGWDTTAFPDGDYTLQVVAEDTCALATTVQHSITIDNTPPVALLTSPDPCTAQYGLVTITGTVTDANLLHWSLEYSDPNGPGWITIANGSTPVIDGVLGTLDMASLPRCSYTLRLIATDESIYGCDDRAHSEYTLSLTNMFPNGGVKHAQKP